MFKQLINKLSGRYERLDDKDIERAIDLIITETDPRLRIVRAYKRKLRKPVIRSLAYMNNLVTRIPGPFEISRRAFGADPRINALFGSADDIEVLFSRSTSVRKFFDDNPGSDRVYLPLAMRREEKKILGAALVNDMLRRDVAQTVVNYSDHWLGVCAASEAELRQMLIWRGIHNLAITALETIAALRARSDTLRQQRALLKMKCRNLEARHLGLDAPGDVSDGAAADRQELDLQLEETERELAESSATLNTLDDHLRLVCQVFRHPSPYLRVKLESVRVNRMGIKSTDPASKDGTTIVTAAITIGNKPRFDGILVSFQRGDLRESPGLQFD